MLLVEHPVAVPALAVLVAAAYTGLNDHPAALQERHVEAGVSRVDAAVKAAVTVDQNGVVAVHLDALLVVNEGGDFRPVLRGVEDDLGLDIAHVDGSLAGEVEAPLEVLGRGHEGLGHGREGVESHVDRVLLAVVADAPDVAQLGQLNLA